MEERPFETMMRLLHVKNSNEREFCNGMDENQSPQNVYVHLRIYMSYAYIQVHV
jgi:hypothetical protein